MLKTIRLISLFLLLIGSSNTLKATHAMAIDMYYEYLGLNTYNFYVKFYRDCDGASAPTSVNISFESNSCSNFNKTLYKVSGPVEVSQLCPTALSSSTCANSFSGTYPGTQEYIYSATINLTSAQAACSDWIVHYNLCCRNSAVSNLASASSHDIYCEISFNPNIQNTSVQYSNIPILYGCVGQQLCFNQGASDSDLDSLSYELVTTKGDFGNAMTFSSGLSISNPVESNNTFNFNTATGQICFTPSQAQFDVLTIKTTEWRIIGGVYTEVGFSTRDVQIIVIASCGALNVGNPVSGFNLTSGNQIDSITLGVCAGNTISFNIIVSDPDTNISYSVSSNGTSATPGAIVNISGSNPVIVNYSWTPPANAAGQYTLSMVIDNMDCPIPQVSYSTYTISVQEDLVVNISDTTICGNSALLDASYPDANYLWSTGQTDSMITVNSSGLYWVNATKGNCSIRDSAQVIFDSTPNTDFSYIPNCQLSTTSFTDLSSNVATSWEWDFGDGSTSNSQSPNHIYQNPGIYNVTLISSSTNGCEDTISKTVNIEAPFTIDLGPDTSQCTGSIPLDATLPLSGLNYDWSNGSTSSNITASSSGLYWVEVEKNGCKDRDSIQIDIYPAPNPNFSFNGGCEGEPVIFTDLSTANISSWHWDFGDNTVTTQQNPIHTYANPGLYGVLLNVTDINGCSAIYTGNVNIDTSFQISASNDTTLCADNFNISANGPSGSNYFWSNNSSTSTATINTSGTYTVTVSKGSCSRTADVTVNLLDLPNASFYIVDSCAFINHALINTSTSNIVSSSWTLPDNSTSTSEDLSHQLNPGDNTVQLIVINGDGCADTLVKNVHILLPDSNINVGGDTTVYENYPAYLYANGGSSYTWSPSNTLDNPLSSTPTATPTDTTWYYVEILDANGCYLTDSVLVEVLDRYELFIPTAFSPNGDGKNELYQVHGHGVKDYEIMIFDRWGEIIYTSNDIMQTWNGQIRGKDSNSETFGYYIKAVFMNHTEEEHKGKITILK